MIPMGKRWMKKSKEELQEYLKFKRRGFIIPNKKGKGSYSRKQKHRGRNDLPLCYIEDVV